MSQQAPVVIPPEVQYEYSYSYSYSSESTTPNKKVVPSEENNNNVRGSPLDLLSSAASAVIYEEESTVSSSSSQIHRNRSSTPPPKPQALPRRPPIAYAVPSSPPTAFAVSSPAHFSTVTAAVGPHPHMRTNFPPFQDQSFPMPPGMEITLSQHSPSTPPPPPVIPHEITTGNNHWKLPRKSSVLKAKRQNPKYRMKFQYVSMKRSEAVKYIEALSRSYDTPLSYQQPENYAPFSRHIPAPPALGNTNYRLPVATAVLPRH